jgi:hypothetical protein
MDTNSHTYEIWWSNSKVWWYIDDVLRHTYTASAAPWTCTHNQQIRLSNKNAGNTNNALLECRVASIYSFGKTETEPKYVHISGAVTAQVLKRDPARLHNVMINTAGTLVTLYDGTSASAPIIATIDINKTTGQLGNIDYHVNTQNGLTVKTTGAGTDITVIYE